MALSYPSTTTSDPTSYGGTSGWCDSSSGGTAVDTAGWVDSEGYWWIYRPQVHEPPPPLASWTYPPQVEPPPPLASGAPSWRKIVAPAEPDLFPLDRERRVRRLR
jgi:hypothetical protein